MTAPVQEFSSPETAALVEAYLVNHPRSSVRHLALACGISPSTAARAVARLRATGVIDRVRRGTSRGYPSHYQRSAP